MDAFQGFSPETVDFLWGIRLNNNRDWFLAHKAQYDQTLYQPMKALSQVVFAAFQDVPNLACKLSRIYRDARLHPPTPYKESLWLSMRPDGLAWSEQPTLYFEIRPEAYSYGFVLWRPKTAALSKFRSLLDYRPEEFLDLVKKLEGETGLMLTGEQYQRKRACPNAAVAPYYNVRGLMMDCDRSPDELLFSPALAGEVVKTLKALLPLYEYCLRFTSDV